MNAPRLSADARREQILDVAIQVFGRAGYYGASMNDIADAAGVTKPVLYQHFDSKSDLYAALLDEVGHADVAVDHEGDRRRRRRPRADRSRGFRAYFRWVAQRHDEFMLLFGGSARHAEEFADQIRAITDEAAAAIAPLIAVDIDPEHRDTLAHALVGLAEGASRRLVGLGERFDPDEIAREVSALAWAGLRAVQRPPSRRAPLRMALARQTPDLPFKKRRSRTDQIGDVVRSPCARHRRLHRFRGRPPARPRSPPPTRLTSSADLATDGAHLVAEESRTARRRQQSGDCRSTELAEARSTLRTVDAQATAIMQQLDLLGVDLSNAIRAAMAPLPTPGSSSAEMQPPLPPPTIVYDAAIADLMRIAATPAALTPITKNADSGGTSFGLLAVAAAALLALGLAALANTLRRTDDDDDLAAMAWSDGLTGVANRRRLDRDIAVHTGGCRTDGGDHGRRRSLQAGQRHVRAPGRRRRAARRRRRARNTCAHATTSCTATAARSSAFCSRALPKTRRRPSPIAWSAQCGRSCFPNGRHITVSVGVADGRAGDVAGTLETADRAMYAAKAGGRDRIRLATLESV